MGKIGWLIIPVGALVLVGCTSDGSSRPTASQLVEGLNLLDTHDPSFGVSGAYKQAARVIYFESRVGALKPEIYRHEFPNDPPNEQDLRVVDQDGHTFWVQRGGDTFVDPSWDADVKKAISESGKIKPELRAVDFKLMQLASQAASTQLPAIFKNHIAQLKNIAALMPPSEDPAMVAKAQRINAQAAAPTAAPSTTGYGNYNYGAYSYFETDKYDGNIAWGIANHTDTAMWDCVAQPGQNCSWVLAINACNHGRCYYDSGMGYDCSSSGGWFWNATITGETNGNNSINGGSLSGYNWDTPPGHECNSDAAYELWQAKSGSLNTSQGGQWTFHWNNGNDYWCSTPSGGGSGDWGTPSCP